MYIHNWFDLTYSSYLVLPRLVLQSMPSDWQEKLVELLDQIEETIELPENYSGNYLVRMRVKGKFANDPLSDYRRGTVQYKQR